MSAVGALFGAHVINLAALSAAIMAGPGLAHGSFERWIATVTGGAAYVFLGLAAGLAASLVSVTPPLLITTVAGLAMLGALVSSVAAALEDPAQSHRRHPHLPGRRVRNRHRGHRIALLGPARRGNRHALAQLEPSGGGNAGHPGSRRRQQRNDRCSPRVAPPVTSLSDLSLSVLDLASVYEGMTHAEALAQTIETARVADELGYERFWVAEHHGMPAVASSAPAVLIGAIASATKRIRVGSGGVMLPNHSSMVVAEQFGTLVALHGDRIDLGLGRAPGTDPAHGIRFFAATSARDGG